MEEGVNETGTGLFRATVYECWEVSHSPYFRGVPSWERITLLYLERTLHFLSLREWKGAGRAVSIVTMLQGG
jgi:hypothetical protein